MLRTLLVATGVTAGMAGLVAVKVELELEMVTNGLLYPPQAQLLVHHQEAQL